LDPAVFFPYWSRELFHIYGLNPAKEGPSLEEYLELIHPQDREFMRSLIKRMLAETSGCDVTKRIVRPNHEVRHIRCVGTPVVENGTLQRIIGTAMDVTEQEHLTQELQRREAYLAEAQRLSRTGSFGWKVASGEILWSEETFRIFEYDRTAKPTVDLVLQRVHPEDAALVKQIIERASRDGKDFDFEHRLLMPDSSVKHVRVVAHALSVESESVEFVGAVMDITDAKQVEERIRRIINAVPGLHWSARPDGWVDFINQRWLDYTGMTLEQALGWGWTPAYHPDEIEQVQVKWRTAVAEGKPLEMETRLRRFDGEYRWFLERVYPWFDRAGRILGWYGSDIDMHDRKQAEEKLQQSEAYLLEAQRLSHTGNFGWNVSSGEIYWSEEIHNIFQHDRAVKPTLELVFQRIHPEDRAPVQQQIDRASRDGKGFDFEHRLQLPDGSIKHVRVTAHPSRDSLGNLEFVGAVTDVSEQRQAEAVIREREREVRQIVDLAPQLVGVYGSDLERLYANRMVLDYHGVRLDEWLQMSRGSLTHPDDSERVKATRDRAVASGSAYEVEVRLRKYDGSYRWFLARFNPVRDDKGQITRWYVASTDIEDRKQAEEKLQQENAALREEIDQTSMFEEIVGTSPALAGVLSRISKVAPTDSTVLITGETGTGKELVARAIHRRSHRSSRPFVSVNCAAIPRDLVASELFGHEKGAFTGATQRRVGRFELAGGGTIFLDEVGELPAETQIALLRVLQEHEFERVGGTRSNPSDVRVIAATNRDLQAAIAGGGFRNDLYYRLNVFPIEIPPLRDRREDIPLLVEYFIDRFARKARKSIRRVNKKTWDLLRSYPWPGNIRELQNVIERSVIVCETDVFSVDGSWLSHKSVAAATKGPLDLSEKFAAQEKEMIETALRDSGGRVFGPSGAAAKLGMPRSTLESKIRSLKINKNRFKTADPVQNS
jgi:PAS domain S-box-containing protein